MLPNELERQNSVSINQVLLPPSSPPHPIIHSLALQEINRWETGYLTNPPEGEAELKPNGFQQQKIPPLK